MIGVRFVPGRNGPSVDLHRAEREVHGVIVASASSPGGRDIGDPEVAASCDGTALTSRMSIA